MFDLAERRLKEELIAVCSYLKGSYRDNRAKLFSSDRQYKGTGHKLHLENLRWDINISLVKFFLV